MRIQGNVLIWEKWVLIFGADIGTYHAISLQPLNRFLYFNVGNERPDLWLEFAPPHSKIDQVDLMLSKIWSDVSGGGDPPPLTRFVTTSTDPFKLG